MATHLLIPFIFVLSSLSGCLYAESIRKELRTKEGNGDKVIQLGHPVQLNVIDPSRVIQLSWQPRVFLYKGFLSEDESDHLISLVHGEKRNSVPMGDLENVNTVKYPSNLVIPLTTEDEVVRRIEERISAWTFIPRDNGRPLQVLHFGDEESRQNYSYFGNKSTILPHEPLMATVILYLSNVSQGGRILFPESKSKFFSDCTSSIIESGPRKGNAVVFFNAHLNASPDRSSSHVRCPVLEGEMWCAIKFFHLRAIRGEKEILRLKIDDSDCTDEDENCSHWAAIGECQRNPVFMMGSPDYYGTCRKSCDAC